jgi:hypothetical protein
MKCDVTAIVVNRLNCFLQFEHVSSMQLPIVLCCSRFAVDARFLGASRAPVSEWYLITAFPVALFFHPFVLSQTRAAAEHPYPCNADLCSSHSAIATLADTGQEPSTQTYCRPFCALQDSGNPVPPCHFYARYYITPSLLHCLLCNICTDIEPSPSTPFIMSNDELESSQSQPDFVLKSQSSQLTDSQSVSFAYRCLH